MGRGRRLALVGLLVVAAGGAVARAAQLNDGVGRSAPASSVVIASPVLPGAALPTAEPSAGEPATWSAEPSPARTAAESTPTPTPTNVAGESSPVPAQPPVAAPAPPRPQLPRGGRHLFPRYRLVGYAGAPGAAALGRLGIGDLDTRAAEIERRLAAYASNRRILPVLELITTVAQAAPGRDGRYRTRQPSSTIRDYLRAARRVHGLLLLDIQPGRAAFLDEVHAYARWLREPDVGLALDPEWAIGPGEVPGVVYGSTTGAELAAVGRYVSQIVRRYDLPDKPIVYHQVARSVVRHLTDLRPRPGVVWIRSVDGIGSPADKRKTWRVITRTHPRWLHGGFKLFYVEDRRSGPLMTPRQVLALRPLPEYVLYE